MDVNKDVDSTEKLNQTDADRRHLTMAAVTGCVTALVGLFPFGAGLAAYLSPLYRKQKLPAVVGTGAVNNISFVCSLNALQIGAAPQRFKVKGDQFNAWNFEAQKDIGDVFVRRTSPDRVQVLNATCPHAGCAVACNGTAFVCPCHNSSFDLDGAKLKSDSGRENPSPRSMDPLDVDSRKLAEGEIWVEFQNFYTGREDRKPKT
ncbi:MAG: hypothetical protein CMJ81_05860 [Planctomycetaceae bacterium]|jgi:nitrite reductase/ring-hydroxylating ferredoxin subunit|nr:hypothetical protein [Planctomycetaceae bacterium]MBP63404.1 hypothetical protein [Planctomycetaceae bacterium]